MTRKLVIIGNGMAPGRMLEHLFETIFELTSVVEPSQRVCLGHMTQALVGLE